VSRSSKPLALAVTTLVAVGAAAALLHFVESRRCGDEVQGLVIAALAIVLLPTLLTLFWGRRRWWWGVPCTLAGLGLLLANFEPFASYDCFFTQRG
jgi:hypothetical protein